MFYMASFTGNFYSNAKDLVCYDCNRPLTRNCLGQGSFLGVRPFWSTIMYTTRKKGHAGKIPRIFLLQTLKYCILNEKFFPLMVTIRAFFPKIKARFSKFPSPVTRLCKFLIIYYEYYFYLFVTTFFKGKIC